MIMQALPLLACISIRKPFIRAFEGFVYLLGVFFLGAFMTFWSWHWVFLVCFFIDWDFFIQKYIYKKHPAIDHDAVAKDVKMSVLESRSSLFYIFVYITVFVVTIAHPVMDKLRLYPFGFQGYYRSVRALEPYDQHFPYTLFHNYYFYSEDGINEVKLGIRPGSFNAGTEKADRVTAFLNRENNYFVNQNKMPEKGGFLLYTRTWLQNEAYPGSPYLDTVFNSKIAVLDRKTGNVYQARAYFPDGDIDDRLIIDHQGFKNPDVDCYYRENILYGESPENLVKIDGTWIGEKNTYIFDKALDKDNKTFTCALSEAGFKFEFIGPEN